MKAKVVTQLQKCHLIEKMFYYITYGSAEHGIFITKIDRGHLEETIEFVGDVNLKLSKGTQFFIGKSNDKKLKMEVI